MGSTKFVLPTQKSKSKIRNPRKLCLYGESKVGKTTAISELENALIIDTEKGTDFLEVAAVQPENFTDFIQIATELSKPNAHKYDYIVIDTIDNLVSWIEAQIVIEHNLKVKEPKDKVASFNEIPYGAGYSRVAEKTLNMIDGMSQLTPHLIIVGHLKRTLIGQNTIEVKEESLDLTGKLRNQIMADMDAIGVVHRDKSDDNSLHVSFMNAGGTAAGSRCSHLINQDFKLDWKKIYID
ncbi:MAG: ATP-binding protein [Richelia sp. RM2_1_2]|nr:ATP-binding protein [Richelia sp. RM2_1_2]